MNQFKKAKQLGNQTESITDLKTAGVALPKKDTPNTDIEIPENKDATHSDISTEESVPQIQPMSPAQNTVLQKTELSETPDPATDTLIPANKVEESKKIVSQPAALYENTPLKTTTMSSQPMASSQYAIPVIQSQLIETTSAYVEPVETKTAKNSKKNAPNMFTQKTESKSIRKSLVLKPTSVKKAESYCAKNGGSFNELIQILLDNFIEEYDL